MQKPMSDTKLLSVLLFLCLVPVLSGSLRMVSLAIDGAASAENVNYLANPMPIIAHVLSYMIFCVFGTFQIAPVFRQRHIKLHRLMGRLLLPIGYIAAFSGIWMTLYYPPLPTNGEAVGYVRIVFGIGMMLCITLGAIAIWRRDIPKHQVWMLRSYAIALGASTQAVVAIFWFALIGQPQGVPWAIAMFITWVFNLLVVEWYLERQRATA
ncbi:DUF2306 domain-containing protein [Planktotalea sp.]|uniref:DUF2306 domain-containing protein n=1 Tax=Planktotalea sp. TaxID=2029877 RepID=UPI0032998A1F